MKKIVNLHNTAAAAPVKNYENNRHHLFLIPAIPYRISVSDDPLSQDVNFTAREPALHGQ